MAELPYDDGTCPAASFASGAASRTPAARSSVHEPTLEGREAFSRSLPALPTVLLPLRTRRYQWKTPQALHSPLSAACSPTFVDFYAGLVNGESGVTFDPLGLTLEGQV